MPRLLFALTIFGLLATPAEAARLVHPSHAAKSVENGVSVWRGEAQEKIAPPALKPARCARTMIVLKRVGYPARRAATHGFWSGDALDAAYGVTTQGFFADRMAAGL